MYTTKPLSLYKNSPEEISLHPEGLNSGYLVIQDEIPTTFFGLIKDNSIKVLPFPQNKRLEFFSGGSPQSTSDVVYLIPVINQPLSSNRYYAIRADGRKQKGEPYASSREEDSLICCFGISCIQDVQQSPPFDPEDVYQQFKFSETISCCNDNILVAKSVAPDGHPPGFLRGEGLDIYGTSIKNFTMREAQGIDPSLRARLPDFSFPSFQKNSSSVVVGEWYSPFMFIREGRKKDQIKNSLFYKVTLEQCWERIFTTERSYSQGKNVTVDVVVPAETVEIAGQEATQRDESDGSRVVWFKTIDGSGAEKQVGLSSLIVERMIWEQERVGWMNKNERYVRVVRDEQYGGVGDWRSFNCYLLVETFILRRNDGSIALTYDFRHTHQIRSKWE